ncbi:MAG: hypothetical protein ACTSPG_08740 [Candidatus Hodarchaeales archaeon]
MTTNLPDGVLVKVEKIKERCGNCNKPFTMETYLNPLTEKRTYVIKCLNCEITTIPEDDDY